jgi:pimeloyl-ACP methyl ester carboxylesterase
MKKFIAVLIFVFAAREIIFADGIRLENFDYPFPVKMFKFTSQKQNLEMAYMDVSPTNANPPTVVLLHGKNFSGAYWAQTATALRDAGFRVIMPDQIGFGKSSKPENYQFTFQQLALNTHALLTNCGVTQAFICGHSMGGMIATRYALMFPAETISLLLVDPIGLEDWKAKGVPYLSVDQQFQNELNQTPKKIHAYEKENYYHGDWKPAYDRWANMLTNFLASPDYPRMAWDQALTTDMIFTQPVCYEFQNLDVPVLLIVGELDRTAIGKDRATPAVKKTLGNYPELGLETAAKIPHAKLVEIPGAGHLPQIEKFSEFFPPFLSFLQSNSVAAKK